MKCFSMLIIFISMMINYCHCAPDRDVKKQKEVRRFGIVGGKQADVDDYPYQGAFLFNGKLKCGCSIISKDCFLTAAHCTDQFNTNVSVRIGSSHKDQGGYIFDIPDENIIQHELFHPVRLNFDFAILKPSQNISIRDPKVKRIKLLTPSDNFNDGTSCRVSGWGKMDDDSRPEMLRAVDVNLVNQKICEQNYNNSKVRFRITPQMICAGWEEGVRDACSGDSGGPLVCKNTQVGVVSSGFGCGMKGFPGIYAKVSTVYDWIKQYCDV